MINKNTYGKHEKLKSRKLIDEVFNKGKVVKAYPLRLHYLIHEHREYNNLQAGVSVSKRNFKKATNRNRVKRLLREAYRLQNKELKMWLKGQNKKLALMIIFGNNELPDFSITMKRTNQVLTKLLNRIAEDN